MTANAPHPEIRPPSPWVIRFAPLVSAGGAVLDVACGAGRHAVFMAGRGHPVTAVDRDISAVPQAPGIEIVEADLESGAPWPFEGRSFDGIVATNYLYRPLLPVLIEALAPGGVLIYETFAVGNEAYGRPRNPDFLLRDGELLDTVASRLRVVAYEAGYTETPAPSVVQRISAVSADRTDQAIPPPA